MKDRDAILTIIAGAFVESNYHQALYGQSVILVDKSGSTVPRVVRVDPLEHPEKITALAQLVLLQPSKGDTLWYDGTTWQVVRMNGTHFPIPDS